MNAPTIIAERLAEITVLGEGAHDDFNAGVCAMEAASYIAGEPWSDHPQCVCPVIAAFMRAWNDALPDDERTRLLLPLIPKTIGTRGSDKLAKRRGLMAVDWLVRVNTPAWLRLAGLDTHADALSGLPEITDMAQAPLIRRSIEAAMEDARAARAAAWVAATDAAWVAATDAVRDAAWDAAVDAAWASATGAEVDAAWAARDAGRDAAWAAAGKKLTPVKVALQQSAVTLIERMCALTEADVRREGQK